MRKVIGILLLWSLAAVGMAGNGNGNSGGGNDNCQGDCNDPADPSTPTAAPEIDPAGAASALTLLAGGLAVLRGRREKK